MTPGGTERGRWGGPSRRPRKPQIRSICPWRRANGAIESIKEVQEGLAQANGVPANLWRLCVEHATSGGFRHGRSILFAVRAHCAGRSEDENNAMVVWRTGGVGRLSGRGRTGRPGLVLADERGIGDDGQQRRRRDAEWDGRRRAVRNVDHRSRRDGVCAGLQRHEPAARLLDQRHAGRGRPEHDRQRVVSDQRYGWVVPQPGLEVRHVRDHGVLGPGLSGREPACVHRPQCRRRAGGQPGPARVGHRRAVASPGGCARPGQGHGHTVRRRGTGLREGRHRRQRGQHAADHRRQAPQRHVR